MQEKILERIKGLKVQVYDLSVIANQKQNELNQIHQNISELNKEIFELEKRYADETDSLDVSS
jgi:peptidoglycan hydrolase CwlO-like protein